MRPLEATPLTYGKQGQVKKCVKAEQFAKGKMEQSADLEAVVPKIEGNELGIDESEVKFAISDSDSQDAMYVAVKKEKSAGAFIGKEKAGDPDLYVMYIKKEKA